VLQRLSLRGFKAFERFTLNLTGDAYLAGPNNAGKTTLIAALRVTAQMLRIAMRRNPTDVFNDGSQEVLGYAFTGTQVGLEEENLRHEFRDLEARIVARFRNDAVVTAVWPIEGAGDPFFYLQQGRASINNLNQARDAFPSVGIVPVLSPVDREEESLTPKYVRENLDGRLASRHFRNQLLLLDQEPPGQDLDAFYEFAERWAPDITIRGLDQHVGEKKVVLDLYYTETGQKTERELVWAGDGIQIWLQILLHVFRLHDRDVIVLDEPDVFLHPDLQRRLVELLESLPGQTITATHSAEVLAEGSPGSAIWIDKQRRSSVSAPSTGALAGLSEALGTQFKIELARALRARCALFVEGQDIKILRRLAAKVGASGVASETGIAVIPLRGFDRWEHVEPFAWMVDGLLDKAVKTVVVLDRDYRNEAQCRAVRERLRRIGIRCHVWQRKELESYLLDARVIGRMAGADEEWIEEALAEAAEQSEEHVFAQVTAEALRQFPRDHQTQAVKEARRAFSELWKERATRKWVAPPDLVLRGLNRRLEKAGFDDVSFRALASEMSADEVPPEMVGFLDSVEEILAGVR
jgi:hypothetical protein